jgi:hypothetical protein
MWTLIEDGNVDYGLWSTLGPLTFLWLGLRRPDLWQSHNVKESISQSQKSRNQGSEEMWNSTRLL